MGVVQLTTVTAINMMGSGIILLPATLAEVGTVSIFAWILASIGATILAYAFAKCGMFTKKVGGMGIALADREISSLTSAIRFPSSLRMLLSQAALSATAHMSSALTFRRSKSASLPLLLSFLQRPSVWSARRNLANSPLSVSSAS